jgi:hypothetical protein
LANVILEYIKVLAWPLIVIVSLILFRKDIVTVIHRISKFDIFGVSAELRERLVEEATPAPSASPKSASNSTNLEEQAEKDIELSASTGAYSSDYRAILLVIGITNRGDKPDQVVSWKLHFPALDIELEPTSAPANLIPGIPWWASPLVKIPANEFIQGSLFFRGRKALQHALPTEPLAGELTAHTLRGQTLSRVVTVYSLSTLQAEPGLSR